MTYSSNKINFKIFFEVSHSTCFFFCFFLGWLGGNKLSTCDLRNQKGADIFYTYI